MREFFSFPGRRMIDFFLIISAPSRSKGVRVCNAFICEFLLFFRSWDLSRWRIFLFAGKSQERSFSFAAGSLAGTFSSRNSGKKRRNSRPISGRFFFFGYFGMEGRDSLL